MKKSNKGLEGIIKAADSWKNVKPCRNRLVEARIERDWKGVHFSSGTMGLGFFNRSCGKKSQKSLSRKQKKFK